MLKAKYRSSQREGELGPIEDGIYLCHAAGLFEKLDSGQTWCSTLIEDLSFAVLNSFLNRSSGSNSLPDLLPTIHSIVVWVTCLTIWLYLHLRLRKGATLRFYLET